MVGPPQRFQADRARGEHGGPPSVTGTARFVLATFYIAFTPLSRRTSALHLYDLIGLESYAPKR